MKLKRGIALKSALWAPLSTSVLKALILAGIFTFSAFQGFSLWPSVLFIGAGIILYTIPAYNLGQTAWAFIVLMWFSWRTPIMLGTLIGALGIEHIIVMSIGLAIAFFLLIGMKQLVIINKSRWYQVLYYGELYVLIMSILIAAQIDAFFIHAAAGFILTLFLFNELLTTKLEKQNREGRMLFSIAAVVAWTMVQFTWGLALLPTGLINSAALGIVMSVVMGELIVEGLEKRLSAQSILSKVTLGTMLSLLILVAANWK
jgi:hypothetical protein